MVTNFIHAAGISALIWSFLLTEELGRKMKMCILTSSDGHSAFYIQHLLPPIWTGIWAATNTPGFGEAALKSPVGG